MKRAAAWALGLAAFAAAAGPLEVRSPDGGRWRINDDDTPTVVERRLPGGTPDPAFGRNGRVPLDFGGREVDVTALRVDTAGRIWLAGTTLGGGMSAAVVQRLQPSGALDTAWAVGGRSTAAPTGQRLHVVDLLPMPDGSAWVAGNLVSPQGAQDAGLWRLKPDGALDHGFATGGLWKRSGPEHSEAMGLAAGPGGRIALGLDLLGAVNGPSHEVHEWAPGERQLRAVPAAALNPQDEDDDEAWILWAGRGWAWRPGPQVALPSGLPVADWGAPPPAAPAPTAPADDGHTALNPFAQADAASAPTSFEPAADELPWGWLVAALAGVAALLFFWRRGAKKA